MLQFKSARDSKTIPSICNSLQGFLLRDNPATSFINDSYKLTKCQEKSPYGESSVVTLTHVNRQNVPKKSR